MSLSYLPGFVTKASSERYPLPHFLFVRSLEAFVAILLEDRWLCPAWAIHIYLDLPASFCFVLMSFSCLLIIRHVRYRKTLYRSFYMSHL